MTWTKWRPALLAAAYVTAGSLFITAVLQFFAPGPAANAILSAGIGVILIALAVRFLSESEDHWGGGALLLLGCWAAAGGAFVYALVQVTPAGPPRQFVLFGGTGVVIALLTWRFLSAGRFRVPGIKTTDENQLQRDTRYTRDFLLAVSYVGAAALLIYSVHSVVPAGPVEALFRSIGAGLLIAAASLVSGALLGFLFGIPRAPSGPSEAAVPPATPAAPAAPATPAGASAATAAIAPVPSNTAARRPGFQVNTNLEQISDWLTKIIVGLGLINLEKFPGYFRDLGAYCGIVLGGDGSRGRDTVALSIVILFSICGFLLGYLLTRLFLTGAFVRAESGLDEVKRIVNETGHAPPPRQEGEPPMSVDQRQVIAAQRVNEAASAADVTQLNRQIYALAQEYDLRRSTMEFSPERTRVLDGIVAKMRVLHGPTYGLLPQLVAGSTPGERLAALAFLQMRPSPEYLEWLSRRFEEEKPFLEYHAALALRAAAETLGPQHQAAIRSAIETARKAGLDKATKAIVDAAAKAVGMED